MGRWRYRLRKWRCFWTGFHRWEYARVEGWPVQVQVCRRCPKVIAEFGSSAMSHGWSDVGPLRRIG